MDLSFTGLARLAGQEASGACLSLLASSVFVFCVCMNVFACMGVYVLLLCSAYEDQKRALEPLKLELQVVESILGAGTPAWVLWKSSSVLSH